MINVVVVGCLNAAFLQALVRQSSIGMHVPHRRALEDSKTTAYCCIGLCV